MVRFTARDLLWLTALIAIGLGWILDRTVYIRELASYRDDAERWRQVEAAITQPIETLEVRPIKDPHSAP